MSVEETVLSGLKLLSSNPEQLLKISQLEAFNNSVFTFSLLSSLPLHISSPSLPMYANIY